MATANRIDVMISSTALDLPEHRKQVMDAILRMGMHPIGMEHLSAMNADAIDASLAMVDEAEIYVGIFAHRYGYIPDSPKNPNRLSVTEMEYRRAVERDIPRLIFIMADDHPIDAKMLETNPEGAQKLLLLKNELKANYVASFFNSQDMLREQVLSSLSAYRNRELSTVETIHYIRDIPTAPEPYIAHPYTLLQTGDVVGRRAELSLLTDWVAKPDSEVYQARILNFVAIGGMGKSALTWKWFNEIAPQEMKPLAGRMWWSFYESDASFENFIIRALAYVSGRSREEIAKDTKPGEREDQLLQILNQQPFLLVLDGLERILIAYARMDAAHLSDDEIDKQTANRVAGAIGLPESAGQSFVGEHRLRKTADPRSGSFLRKLAAVQKSRILVSTRLYPRDLQTNTGYPMPGCYAVFLTGLEDDDAVELWRAMKVSGSRDTLLPVFRQFENYPLLIRALAGEVARYKRAPGDFDAWLKTYPDFQRILNGLYQQDAKSHVLSYALQGLTEDEKRVLHTIAAFRMPASYETLVALLVDQAPSPPTPLPTSRYRSLGEGSPAAFGSGEELRQENGRYREMAAQVMVTLARDLRQRQTNAEDRLWQCLRDRRLNDLKFRRQHPIAKTTYIADFFCYQAKLVIELDGGIHDTQQEQDARRQQEIEALGYRVLRFRNERIERDLETVLVEILGAAMPSSPTLRPEGEGSQTAVGDEKTPGLKALANGEMDSPRPGSDSDWSEEEGDQGSHGVRAKTRITTESALDTILFALEDRGVLGWDRAANRYDLHPIVRSVVWGELDSSTRDSIYSARVSHFEPIAQIEEDRVEKFEDLTPAVELYHTLIGLGRYDDASWLFYQRLSDATLYRLSSSRQRIELLERLFPDGIDQLPCLTEPAWQAWTLNALAQAYQLSGLPGQAVPMFRRKNEQLDIPNKNYQGIGVGLRNLSDALRLSGSIYDAEHAARQALIITREQSNHFQEAVSLQWLGLALAARLPSPPAIPDRPPLPTSRWRSLGEGSTPFPSKGSAGVRAGEIALRRSRQMFIAQNATQSEGLTNAFLAQTVLWRPDFAAARVLADRAWELAKHYRAERDFIRAARLQGEAALGLGDYSIASERLHHALTRARAVNYVEEELPALIALAELARQQGDPTLAREHLDDVWEGAERGPYPLLHADALNVLAQIERDAGNEDAAIAAATKAYEKAWCDGISADGTVSYAYWWGLQKAKAHLEALGAPLPSLPPFDPANFEPMPEVEINPKDEFWVDESQIEW